METFSVLLVLCAGNSPLTGKFPSQRPVTRCFDVFFDLRLNKRLSKQSKRRWFEMPPCVLWRHCNAIIWYMVPLSIRLLFSTTVCQDHWHLNLMLGNNILYIIYIYDILYIQYTIPRYNTSTSLEKDKFSKAGKIKLIMKCYYCQHTWTTKKSCISYR